MFPFERLGCFGPWKRCSEDHVTWEYYESDSICHCVDTFVVVNSTGFDRIIVYVIGNAVDVSFLVDCVIH